MVKGKIAEVFESIQGEGLYLGEKQVFVRFFGCNLDCKFCDTKLTHFSEYGAEELFEEIKTYANPIHSISFTGGEPLLQKDFLKEVLRLAHQHGFKNYLDTNGTLANELEEAIDYLDIIAMDLKLPSSTGLNNFWDAHRRFLKIASRKEVFLKAVICESTEKKDLAEALKLIKETNRYAALVLQPDSNAGHNRINEKLEGFRDFSIDSGVTTCIIPQMHKMVGVR
jgi:organic radical activating enzyme